MSAGRDPFTEYQHADDDFRAARRRFQAYTPALKRKTAALHALLKLSVIQKGAERRKRKP